MNMTLSLKISLKICKMFWDGHFVVVVDVVNIRWNCVLEFPCQIRNFCTREMFEFLRWIIMWHFHAAINWHRTEFGWFLKVSCCALVVVSFQVLKVSGFYTMRWFMNIIYRWGLLLLIIIKGRTWPFNIVRCGMKTKPLATGVRVTIYRTHGNAHCSWPDVKRVDL